MRSRLLLVDSLCDDDEGARGGPAGVCLSPEALPEATMRLVATELARPETAFVAPAPQGEYALRWFSPSGAEVELCGYATLAAAHALWEEGWAKENVVRFAGRAGHLAARRRGGGRIEIDLPALAPEPYAEGANAIAAALGSPRPAAGAWRTREDILVLLDDEEALAGLRPDMRALAAWHPRAVTATAPSRDGYALRSFAPGWGIPEDEATGGVQGALARLWARLLERRSFEVRQRSPRGARMRVTLHGERVLVEGLARTRLALALP